MFRTKSSLITVFVLLMTTAALADGPVLNSYTYRVKVPAIGGMSCADHATSLAAAFGQATATAVQNVSGACESSETLTDGGSAYLQDIIVVSYQGATTVQTYQAILGGSIFEGQATEGSALIPAYADCLAQLATQQPLFESETGLAMVAGYCSPSTDVGGSGFSLTLEGFGQPARSLFGFASDPTIVGDAFSSDEIQAATSALKQASADIAYTDATHVYYYAQYDPSVTTSDLGTFSVKDECTSQQAAAQAIFTQAGLLGVTALCEGFGSATSTETTLEVVGAGMTEASDDYGDSSPVYDTFAECTADMSRLVANESQDGGTVYGAVCEPSEDTTSTFQAHLFTNF